MMAAQHQKHCKCSEGVEIAIPGLQGEISDWTNAEVLLLDRTADSIDRAFRSTSYFELKALKAMARKTSRKLLRRLEQIEVLRRPQQVEPWACDRRITQSVFILFGHGTNFAENIS